MSAGEPGLRALVEATVAVRDPAATRAFCRDAFELDVLADDVGGTVLGVPGIPHGRVRLVAAAADPPVEPPLPWELGPRVLGVRPRDVEASRRRLLGLGTAPTRIVGYDVAPGNTTLEYWVGGPDDVTWEVVFSPRMRSPALEADPARGHGELLASVIATGGLDDALELFVGAGGLRLLGEGVFDGEAFVTLFGLPPGASVRAGVLGSTAGDGMLLELWEFVGVEAVRGPERPVGIQRLAFAAAGAAAVGERLERAGARPVAAGVYAAFGVELELREEAPADARAA